MELIGAVVLVVGVLAGAYVAGKRKKQGALARIEAEPSQVARLYLRADPEIDAFWLHAELRTGKKLRLAAPWDVDATLARLAAVGLQLSANDQAALAAERAEPPTEVRQRDDARGAWAAQA